MYTLFYNPGSASMAVHLALLEIGAPHELKRLDFGKGEQRDADYLRLNPQGVVPTLVIDGQPVVETGALLAILAERHPEAGLAPAPGTAAHMLWRQWLADLGFNLGATFRFWFYPKDLGAEEHPPAVRAALQARIEAAWDRIDKHLAANGPYLLGDKMSSADLLLTMYMRWSRKMEREAVTWPALGRLAALVKARPAWKQLYEREGLQEW